MELIKKNWWFLALQGALFIALGAVVIFVPRFSLTDLLIYLAIIFLAFGIIMFIWGWRKRKTHDNWWGLAFFGVLQIVLGAFILSNPYRASSVFSYAIGGWAAVMGIAQLVLGLGRKKYRAWYILIGAVSITVGLLIIYNPFNNPNSMTYLVGFYSFILGCFLIFYGFRARSLGENKKPKLGPEDQLEGKTTGEE
jgi:uncharacterized membrane protein HdeD (DUF308 family)